MAKVTLCAVARTQIRAMNNGKEGERSDELADLSQTSLNHDISSQGLNKISKGRCVGSDDPPQVFLYPERI